MPVTEFQRGILIVLLVAVVLVCAAAVSIAAIVHDDPRPARQAPVCKPLQGKIDGCDR